MKVRMSIMRVATAHEAPRNSFTLFCLFFVILVIGFITQYGKVIFNQHEG